VPQLAENARACLSSAQERNKAWQHARHTHQVRSAPFRAMFAVLVVFGAARVAAETTSTAWRLNTAARLTSGSVPVPFTLPESQFGGSIAVFSDCSDDTAPVVAVGAAQPAGAGGSVVFLRTTPGGSSTILGTAGAHLSILSSISAGDHFGHALDSHLGPCTDCDGRIATADCLPRLLVGAPGTNSGQGSIWLLQVQNGEVYAATQFAHGSGALIIPASAEFGTSLGFTPAISAGFFTAAVGAPGRSSAAGAVRVVSMNETSRMVVAALFCNIGQQPGDRLGQAVHTITPLLLSPVAAGGSIAAAGADGTFVFLHLNAAISSCVLDSNITPIVAKSIFVLPDWFHPAEMSPTSPGVTARIARVFSVQHDNSVATFALLDGANSSAFVKQSLDLPATFSAAAGFGAALQLVDVGSGTGPTLLVGAPEDSLHGSNTGAVWALTSSIPRFPTACPVHLAVQAVHACAALAADAPSATAGGSQFYNRGNNGISGVGFGAGLLLGSAVAPLGDLDGNGVPDFAVSGGGTFQGIPQRGLILVVFMRTNSTPGSTAQLAPHLNGVPPSADGGRFGSALAPAGDLDGDGHMDLFVGAPGLGSIGQVLAVNLRPDGSASAVNVMFSPGAVNLAPLAGLAGVGSTLTAIGDLDGDGVTEVMIGVSTGAVPLGTVQGAFLVAFVESITPVPSVSNAQLHTELTESLGIANATGSAQLAVALSGLGDVNGDGAPDAAVSLGEQGTGGTVLITFLTRSGIVLRTARLSASAVNGQLFGVPVSSTAQFGGSLAFADDAATGGLPSILVGVRNSASGHGTSVLISLRTDGTVHAAAWFFANLTASSEDDAASSVASLGDVTGTGGQLLVFGASKADRNGNNDEGGFTLAFSSFNAKLPLELPRGVVPPSGADCPPALRLLPGNCSELFALHADAAAQARIMPADAVIIADSEHANGGKFGAAIAPLGDVNGDGFPDIAVGATGVTALGTDGIVSILFMGPDSTAPIGTVNIRENAGLPADLNTLSVGNVELAGALAGLGDVNGDGVPDLAVGAPNFGTYGAVLVIFLTAAGEPLTDVLISEGGPYTGTAIETSHTVQFGASLAALGDADGDGVVELAVGAPLSNPLGGSAQSGRVTVVFVHTRGGVKSATHLAENEGGFTGAVAIGEGLGSAMAFLGKEGFAGTGNSIGVLAAASSSDRVYVMRLLPDGTADSSYQVQLEAGAGALLGVPAGESFASCLTALPDLDGDGVPELITSLPGDGSSPPSLVLIHLGASLGAKRALVIPEDTFGLPDRLPGTVAFASALAVVETTQPHDPAQGPPIALMVGETTLDGAFVDANCCNTAAGGVWSLRFPVPAGRGYSGCPPTMQAVPGACAGRSSIVSTFVNATVPTALGALYRLRALGDLDRDGAPDFACITNQGSGASETVAIVFLEPGTGQIKSFFELTNDISGIPSAGSLDFQDGIANGDLAALPDVNDDGTADLLVVFSGTVMKSLLFLMNTDGTLLEGTIPQLSVYTAGTVLRACYYPEPTLNSGTRAFVLELGATFSNIKALTASGFFFGSSGSTVPMGLPASDYRDSLVSQVGDIDGNAIADIVLANINTETLFLFFLQGTAGNSDLMVNSRVDISQALPTDQLPNLQTFGQTFGYMVAAAGDVDGDGVPDILTMGLQGTAFREVPAGHAAPLILFMQPNGTIRGVTDLGPLAAGAPVPDTAGASTVRSGLAVVPPGIFPGSDSPGLLFVAGAGARLVAMSLSGAFALKTEHPQVSSVPKVSSVRSFSYTGEGGDGNIINPMASGTRQFGWSVTPYADLDGDGLPEIFVGDPGIGTSANNQGNVHLVRYSSGPPFTAARLSSLLDDTTLETAVTAGQRFGSSVAVLGYVNADEYLDIAVGAPANGGADKGTVFVLLMSAGGGVLDSSNTITGQNMGGSTTRLGDSLAALGDIDFDQVPDMISYTHDGYIYSMFLAADGSLKRHRVLAYGDVAGFGGQGMGTHSTMHVSVQAIGDISGDGRADVAFGKAFQSTPITPGVIGVGTILSTGDLQGVVFITDSDMNVNLAVNGLTEFAGGMSFLGKHPATNNIMLAASVHKQQTGANTHGGAIILEIDSFTRALKRHTLVFPGALGWPEDQAGALHNSGLGYSLAYLAPNSNHTGRLLMGAPTFDDTNGFEGGRLYLVDTNMTQAVPATAGTFTYSEPALYGAPFEDQPIPPQGRAPLQPVQRYTTSVAGFTPPVGQHRFGAALAAMPDFNEDTIPDLLVGVQGSNAVFIAFVGSNGSLTGGITLAATGAPLPAMLTGDEWGFAVAPVGDLDGNGVGDIAVGAPSAAGGRAGVYTVLLTSTAPYVAGFSMIAEPMTSFGAALSAFGPLLHPFLGPMLAVGAPVEASNSFINGGKVLFMRLESTGANAGLVATIDDATATAIAYTPAALVGCSLAAVQRRFPFEYTLAVGACGLDQVYLCTLSSGGPNWNCAGIREATSTPSNKLFDSAITSGYAFGQSLAYLSDGQTHTFLVGGTVYSSHGAVWLLTISNLNSPTVQRQQRFSTNPSSGGLKPGDVLVVDEFGFSVAGFIAENGALIAFAGAPGFNKDRNAATQVNAGSIFELSTGFMNPTDGDCVRQISELTGFVGCSPAAKPFTAGPVSTIDASSGKASGGGLGVTPGVGLTIDGSTSPKFGAFIAAVGDVDGDLIVDIAVSAPGNQETGDPFEDGAVFILLMNREGAFKSSVFLACADFAPVPSNCDAAAFGRQLAAIGDINRDGVPDLLVGMPGFDSNKGGAMIMFMFSGGGVQSTAILERGSGTGAIPTTLGNKLGNSVALLRPAGGKIPAMLLLGAPNAHTAGGMLVVTVGPQGIPSKAVKHRNSEPNIPANTFPSVSEEFRVGSMGVVSLGAMNSNPDYMTYAAASAETVGGRSEAGAIFLVEVRYEVHLGTHLQATAVSKITPHENANVAAQVGGQFASSLSLVEGSSQSRTLLIGNSGQLLLSTLSWNNVNTPKAVLNHTAVVSSGILYTRESAVLVPGSVSSGKWSLLHAATNRNSGLFVRADGSVVVQHDALPVLAGMDANCTAMLRFAGACPNETAPLGSLRTVLASGSVNLTLPPGSEFGRSMALVGDLNGDGFMDAAVGAPGYSPGVNQGAVFIMFTNGSQIFNSSGLITNGLGGLVHAGAVAGSRFGHAMAALGDIDGDGITDLGVGAPDGPNGGALFILFLHALGHTNNVAVLDRTVSGISAVTSSGSNIGSCVAGLGHVDRNGVPDVLIGDTMSGGGLGQVLVVRLAADGSVFAQTRTVQGDAANFYTPITMTSYGVACTALGVLEPNAVSPPVSAAVLLVGAARPEGIVHLVHFDTDGNLAGIPGASSISLDSDPSAYIGAPFATLSDIGWSMTGVFPADYTNYKNPKLLVASRFNQGAFTGQSVISLLEYDSSKGYIEGSLGPLRGGFVSPLNGSDGADFGAGMTVLPLGEDGTISFLAGVPDRGSGEVWVVDTRMQASADGEMGHTQQTQSVGTSAVQQDSSNTVFGGAASKQLPPRSATLIGPLTARIHRGTGAMKILDGNSNLDFFGKSASAIGDWNGDSSQDILTSTSDPALPNEVHVVFLGARGSAVGGFFVSAFDLAPFGCTIAECASLGVDVTALGDWDGDGHSEIAASTFSATHSSKVFALHLTADGTVRLAYDLIATEGFLQYLSTNSVVPGHRLGHSLSAIRHHSQKLSNALASTPHTLLLIGNPDYPGGPSWKGQVHLAEVSAEANISIPHRIIRRTDYLWELDPRYEMSSSDSVVACAFLGDIAGNGVPAFAVLRSNGFGIVIVQLVETNTPLLSTTVSIVGNVKNPTRGPPSLVTTLLHSTDPLRVSPTGDLNGDGVPDMAVSFASSSSIAGTDRGIVFFFFLDRDLSIRAYRAVGEGIGGYTLAALDNSALGSSVINLGIPIGKAKPLIALSNHRSLTAPLGSIDVAEGGFPAAEAGSCAPAVKRLFGASAICEGPDKQATAKRSAAAALPGSIETGFSPKVHFPSVLADTFGFGAQLSTRATIEHENAGWSPLPNFPSNPETWARAVAPLGDLNGDGTVDVAFGSFGMYGNDGTETNFGGVYIALMNDDGTVKRRVRHSAGTGQLLRNAYAYSAKAFTSVHAVGDWDGDGSVDVVGGMPGAPLANGFQGGAIVLHLTAEGNAVGYDLYTSSTPGIRGSSTTTPLGEAIGAMWHPLCDTGKPCLLLGSDTISSGTLVMMHADTRNGAAVVFSQKDLYSDFERTLAFTPVGDLTGDSVPDLVVFRSDRTVSTSRSGTVALLALSSAGAVSDTFLIQAAQVPGVEILSAGFGRSITVASLDPVSGQLSLLVGISDHENKGGLAMLEILPGWVLRRSFVFGNGNAGFPASIDTNHGFGSQVASLGDLDGDGLLDVVATAPFARVLGIFDAGRAYVLKSADRVHSAKCPVALQLLKIPGCDAIAPQTADANAHTVSSSLLSYSAGRGAPHDAFGAASVQLGIPPGSRAPVFAVCAPGSGSGVGGIYIIKQGHETPLLFYTPPVPAPAAFGSSVDVLAVDTNGQATHLIAGAPLAGTNARGGLLLLEIVNSTTAPVVTSTGYIGAAQFASFAEDGELMGWAVAVQGATPASQRVVAVGRPGASGSISDKPRAGAVSIVVVDVVSLTGFVSTAAIRFNSSDPQPTTGDAFGSAAVISESGAFVGAPGTAVAGIAGVGVVWALQFGQGDQGFGKAVVPSGLGSGAAFGASVVLSSLDIGTGIVGLMVGAPGAAAGLSSAPGQILQLTVRMPGIQSGPAQLLDLFVTTQQLAPDQLDSTNSSASVFGSSAFGAAGSPALGVSADGTLNVMSGSHRSAGGAGAAHWGLLRGSAQARTALHRCALSFSTSTSQCPGLFEWPAQPVLQKRFTNGLGGLSGTTVGQGDRFGAALAVLGNYYTGDDQLEYAVGAPFRTGGGSVVLIAMQSTGFDAQASLTQYVNAADVSLDANAKFGAGLAALGDFDFNGVPDMMVGAPGEAGNRGAVVSILLETHSGGAVTIASRKIMGGASTANGFTEVLGSGADFGRAVAVIGDLDEDGFPEVAVGMQDSDGATFAGGVRILFMQQDGTLASFAGISNTQGGPHAGQRAEYDALGSSVAGIGDVNGDGVPDLAAGAPMASESGPPPDRGAVWIFFLRANASVLHSTVINHSGGWPRGQRPQVGGGQFGGALGTAGDVNNDGVPDLLVGEPVSTGISSGRGSDMVLFLTADGRAGGFQRVTVGPAGINSRLGSSVLAGPRLASSNEYTVLAGMPEHASGHGSFVMAKLPVESLYGRDCTPALALLPAFVGPCVVAPSVTPSSTASPTATSSPTGTPSPSGTQSSTGTPSSTGTATPSGTPSGTVTPSGTPSSTGTATPSGKPSGTVTPSGTSSSTGTATPSGTPSGTVTPSGTPSPSVTVLPSTSTTTAVQSSPLPTATSSVTPSPAATPSSTPDPLPPQWVAPLSANGSYGLPVLAPVTVFAGSVSGALLAPGVAFTEGFGLDPSAAFVASLACVTSSSAPFPPCVDAATWLLPAIQLESAGSTILQRIQLELGSPANAVYSPLTMPGWPNPTAGATQISITSDAGVSMSCDMLLKITLVGSSGLTASAIIPVVIVPLPVAGASIAPLPSAAPSSAPLVAPSSSGTPAATPSTSPTTRPSQSPGASPSATPSGTPAPLPLLEVFPRSLSVTVPFGQSASVLRTIIVRSSSTTTWSAAVAGGSGAVRVITVLPGSKPALNVFSHTLQLQIATSELRPGTISRTIVITPAHPQSLGSFGGRATADSLQPIAVSVSIQVAAPRSKLSPDVIFVSQLPGTSTSTQLRIANTGSAPLLWRLPTQPGLPWLALKVITPSGATGCAAARQFAVNALGNCSYVVSGSAALNGTVAAGLSTLVELHTVSADASVSGVFTGRLGLETNVPGSPTAVVSVTMRATLISAIPRAVKVAVPPGGSGKALFRLDSLTPDADLVSTLITSGVPAWMQVSSGIGLQSATLQSTGGVQFVAVRVSHGGDECSSPRPSLVYTAGSMLCMPNGQRSMTSTLQFAITARPLDNSTQVRRDLASFSDTISVPVTVSLIDQAIQEPTSGMHFSTQVMTAAGSTVPGNQPTQGAHLALLPASRTKLNRLWLVSRDGAHDAAKASQVLPQLHMYLPQSPRSSAQTGASPLVSSFAALNASHVGLNLLTRTVGSVLLLSTAGGSVLGASARNLSRMICTEVVSPRCDPLSQVLSSDLLNCECSPGFQLASLTGNTTAEAGTCLPCGSGSIRPAASSPAAACTPCQADSFASTDRTQCLRCPGAGFTCAGGVLRPRSGTWCPTCIPSEADFPQNAKLRQRMVAAGVEAGAFVQSVSVVQAAGSSRRLQNSSSETALVRQGMGSYISDDGSVLTCQPAQACQPITDDSGVQCAPGHSGIACGECIPGWGRASAEQLCSECGDATSALLSAVALWVLNVGIVLVLGLKKDESGKQTDTPTVASPAVQAAVRAVSSHSRPQGVAATGLFRLVSSWAQVYALLLGSRIPPRTAIDSVLATVSATSMGFSSSSQSMQCAFAMTPYMQLYVSMALPVTVVLLPALAVLAYNACRCQAPVAAPAAAYSPKSDTIDDAGVQLAAAASPTSSRSESGVSTKATPAELKPVQAELVDDSTHVKVTALLDANDESSTDAGQSLLAVSAVPISLGGAANPRSMRRAFMSADEAFVDNTQARGDVVLTVPSRSSARAVSAEPAAKGAAAAAESGTLHMHTLAPAAAHRPCDTYVTRTASRHSKAHVAPSPAELCRQRGTRIGILLLLLLHFGIVDTCLRVLRLYDVPVLGARLIAANLQFGDMDDEFALARLLASLGLAIFGIGLPLAGTCVLCRSRSPHQLNRPDTKAYFGALFDGYKVGQRRPDGKRESNLWFWELLVVIPRKVMLAIIVSLVTRPSTQASLVMLIMSSSLVLHVLTQPYLLPVMNIVETAALSTLLLASMSGLMLLDSERDGSIQEPVQIALLVAVSLFAICTFALAAHDLSTFLGSNAKKSAASAGQRKPPACWWLCGIGWCARSGCAKGSKLCASTLLGGSRGGKAQAAVAIGDKIQ